MANRHLVGRHFDISLFADRLLTNRHLVNRYFVIWHTAGRQLSDRDLAAWHLVNRHLTKTLFHWHGQVPEIYSTNDWTKCLLAGWFPIKRPGTIIISISYQCPVSKKNVCILNIHGYYSINFLQTFNYDHLDWTSLSVNWSDRNPVLKGDSLR